MALARIFGDQQFFNCDAISIKSVSNGRWEVTVQNDGCADRKFLVVGGRKSGGASNEWYCNCPEFYGEQWLACKSMVQAVRCGVSC